MQEIPKSPPGPRAEAFNLHKSFGLAIFVLMVVRLGWRLRHPPPPLPPKPAWQRLEYPVEVTGNDAKSNALVAGINGFNLLAAVTAPWFIFPRLGIGGIAAYVGLVIVPVVYSTMFFAIPGLRALGVRRENRKREQRNVRRVLLGMTMELTLSKGAGVMLDPAVAYVTSRLKHQTVRAKDVEKELHALAAEFDADVDPDAD